MSFERFRNYVKVDLDRVLEKRIEISHLVKVTHIFKNSPLHCDCPMVCQTKTLSRTDNPCVQKA